MFDQFKKIEASLEAILFENSFSKISEKDGNFWAKLLYKSTVGLYFEIECDYRDRYILLSIGHSYNLENFPGQYILSASYSGVVKACSDSFGEILHVSNYSSWDEYSEKLINYFDKSLPVVLKEVTPAILEELAKERIRVQSPQFRFLKTD